MINKLQGHPDIVYLEPNFTRFIKPHVSDPLIGSQWSINNQGYLGGAIDADMDVDNAWIYSSGENIKIAIIDEGVDLNHPDLIQNLLQGYDATGGNSNGAPSNNGAHGTACAGIVAASTNNIGIAGVAYNSKIIPIKIAYSNESGNWVSSDSWIANGINWAVLNGADILSNSWGGGSPSTTITNSINNAVNNGRNGKGSIVLFSAGNGNSNVSYPATLSNVIAVGASSMCDQRKTPSSCDGESWWGSNFGNEIDIVAPGVQIYTTDITGTAGYGFGDYIPNFNGTSSSCPNVAGVMALILSAKPTLTNTEARYILESSADKVVGYNYANNPSHLNGTWNNEVGYGRINAFKAIEKTLNLGIEDSDKICIGVSSTYTLSNIPIGASIKWEYPTNRMYIISGQGTQSCTFGAFNLGLNNTIKAIITIDGLTTSFEKNIDIFSSTTPPTPTISLAPDNPFNLMCCGQTYTFNHAICTSNCQNLEWEFNVYYKDPADIYFFNTETGQITVQKNTYNPLIIDVRARNVPENCGSPSSWSNGVSRYYGTVSSFSSQSTSENFSTFNADLPLLEYFVNSDNNLHITKLKPIDWLQSKYGNENLTADDVNIAINLLTDNVLSIPIHIKIYDFYGNEVFNKSILNETSIINLSHLKRGFHVVKYNYENLSSSRTIIIN